MSATLGISNFPIIEKLNKDVFSSKGKLPAAKDCGWEFFKKKNRKAMFSVRQKREIADAVQKILRSTNHPELPAGEITFHLHIEGTEAWSWADIKNNCQVTKPEVNPHNEAMDKQ